MSLSEYTFNAASGIVIGKKGRPVGRVCSRGYVDVHDRYNSYRAHRMIWEHVHGKIPDGFEINHKNGIKTDNRIENLELVTKSQNALHAYRLKLIDRAGDKNGRARLNTNDVIFIRQSSRSTRELASEYSVSKTTIDNIKAMRSWRHVK